MPHCILEHSNNIVDQPDFHKLLRQVHEFLAGTGLFKQADIKSRVLCHDLFVVGDGARDRAFVTMNVCIFSGRDDVVPDGPILRDPFEVLLELRNAPAATRPGAAAFADLAGSARLVDANEVDDLPLRRAVPDPKLDWVRSPEKSITVNA